MVITVHLDLGVDRNRLRALWCRQQQCGLLFGEHHRRARARGAVDALAGLLGTPGLGAGLGVGQVGEVLPGEEVVAHVLDHPLDTRFVPRRQLRSIRSVISELFG